MTLINSVLAFGALAFTVPLAIHLLFRSRFRTVPWGAMHLLSSVIQVNRRRMQWMQLLLLMLRCSLPVLLAFCLARPLLTGFQALPGDAPQSLVLVIDDSRSMSVQQTVGGTRLDVVRGQLIEMLQGVSRRDEIIVLAASQIDTPAATMGRQQAIERLSELRAEGGPVAIDRLLRAAVQATEQASHPQRHVVVVSDFQAINADDAALNSLTRLSSTLAERSLRPTISFLDISAGESIHDNVSVRAIQQHSPAVVAGRTARFTAQISNASDQFIRDLPLVWSIDNQSLRPSTISLPPRSTVTTRLSRAIEDVGTHEIAVAIEHSDALAGDNRRAIGVNVIREVEVLLVDGKRERGPLASETDFLAIALSPFAFGGDDQPDAVRTRTIDPQQISKSLQETSRQRETPDLVILANVATVTGEARKSLASFVHDGGAMVVFDGDQVEPESWNAGWHPQWSLPAELGSLVTDEPEDTRFPIADRNHAYTPWRTLGARDTDPFADVEVRNYRRLQVSEAQASDDASVMSLLRFEGGDPVAVMGKAGRGTVVQFAIPADADWTNLPARLVYLPMMQQLVLDLAGSRKAMTVPVGETINVPVSELMAELPEINASQLAQASYTVQPPGGQETNIQPVAINGESDEATRYTIVTAAERAGVYRIRQTIPGAGQANLRSSTMRVVEVPASESELRTMPASRIDAIAELVDAQVYHSLKSMRQDERTRRFGREIWRWLLAVLLVAMLAEMFVQQRRLGLAPAGAT